MLSHSHRRSFLTLRPPIGKAFFCPSDIHNLLHLHVTGELFNPVSSQTAIRSAKIFQERGLADVEFHEHNGHVTSVARIEITDAGSSLIRRLVSDTVI